MCAIPIELVLVLDSSGSMYPYRDAFMRVVTSLVDQFVLASDLARIGIVSFSSSAQIKQGLTIQRSLLDTVTNQYYPGGATAISEGLYSARTALQSARSGTEQVIILVTDGVQNSWLGGDRAAIDAGIEVRASTGATLIAVGFGGAAAQTLAAIATPPASMHSYLATSVSDISTRLADICSIVHSPRAPPPPLPPPVPLPTRLC